MKNNVDKNQQNKASASDSVFHEGEIAMQTRVGMAEKIGEIGKIAIKDFMIQQHRDFFSIIPMIFIGAADKQHDVWASVLFGEPGFIHSPDDSQLLINQQLQALDPLAGQLSLGDDIGLMGIELETRRRNRVNMTLIENTEQQLAFKVKQSFGSCPKYIQRRERIKVEHSEPPASIEFDAFNAELKTFFSRAESFFIASQYLDGDKESNNGVDVSHRGGMPGFIKFNDAGDMLIADFAGNNLYNTLGNIIKDPKVGLLFIDYENSHLVTLTGEAQVIWAEDENLPFKNVDRMIQFRLKRGYQIKHSVPFRWSLEEYSPFSKMYEDI